jgi:hypothetical protein
MVFEKDSGFGGLLQIYTGSRNSHGRLLFEVLGISESVLKGLVSGIFFGTVSRI